MGNEIIQMVLHAGLVVKIVLFTLVVFSVVSWTIILFKWMSLKKAKEDTSVFMDLFYEGLDFTRLYKESEDLPYSPMVALFKAFYRELTRFKKIAPSEDANPHINTYVDTLERVLKKGISLQIQRFERTLPFLATTGNTTPFIGLFGTVWGIMESFRRIGLMGSANLATVAPGISEALVATAAGLAAAIPAVIFFNHFTQQIQNLRSEMESFSSELILIFQRQGLKRIHQRREMGR